MIAFADIAYVDPVKLTVHTVLIELALRHAARYAAVDFVFHIPLLSFYYVPFSIFYENRIDKEGISLLQ